MKFKVGDQVKYIGHTSYINGKKQPSTNTGAIGKITKYYGYLTSVYTRKAHHFYGTDIEEAKFTESSLIHWRDDFKSAGSFDEVMDKLNDLDTGWEEYNKMLEKVYG